MTLEEIFDKHSKLYDTSFTKHGYMNKGDFIAAIADYESNRLEKLSYSEGVVQPGTVANKEEYAILKKIAYCALNMNDSENERNFGDAEEWKQKLKQEIDLYKEKEFDCK